MEALIEAARAARRNAHAPYSGFRVGAAVMAGDRVFVGVNVENASYPLSVCAERNAVGAAIAAGEHEILAVAVVADDGEPTPPCGGCRQVLHEFGPGMRVVSENEEGKRAEWSLAELLPHAFDRSSLD